MKTQLEHANMHVRDVDRIVAFIRTAFTDFDIRFDSGKEDPERWVHVGNDDFYLAIYQAQDLVTTGKRPYDGKIGINHLGFVVSDSKAVRERLLEAGYVETTIENSHPARRRIYFNDPEGNDWEFVEYLTADRKQRNDYLQEMAAGLLEC